MPPLVHPKTFACLVFLLSLTLMVTPQVHAQFFQTGSSGLNLVAVPQFPTPHGTVEVSINDYSIDTIGADIEWFVNGSELRDMRNERSIFLEAGALGEKTTVRAVLTRNNAPTLSKTIELVPSQVDLILEADTYVPSFYQGRALPSRESKVRVIAVVHDAGKTPDTAYTYRWSEGAKVLLGGPVKGKNVLDLTMSRYRDTSLSVEVLNNEGVTVGKRSLTLKSEEPEIHFYEHSPLRGLVEKEVQSPLPLIGEEITVYGEPFFMNTEISSAAADFVWKINGARSSAAIEDPNAITLRHMGGAGEAEIHLSIMTKGRVPQLASKAFSLFFE